MSKLAPTGLACAFLYLAGCSGPVSGGEHPSGVAGIGNAAGANGQSGGNGAGAAGASAGSGQMSGDPALTATDPGRVAMHRLNVTEYNNTVHDLFKTDIK